MGIDASPPRILRAVTADDHPAPPFHTDLHAGRWVRLSPRFDLADKRAAIRLISLVSDSGLSGASPHHQSCRRHTR
jgi:hypothetical protein